MKPITRDRLLIAAGIFGIGGFLYLYFVKLFGQHGKLVTSAFIEAYIGRPGLIFLNVLIQSFIQEKRKENEKRSRGRNASCPAPTHWKPHVRKRKASLTWPAFPEILSASCDRATTPVIGH